MSFSIACRAAAVAALLGPAATSAQPAKPGQPRQPAAKPQAAAADDQFKSPEERLSYVLGVSTARKMQSDGVEPDPQAFARGFADTFAGKDPLFTDEEMTQILDQFREQLREKTLTTWRAAFAGENKPKASKTLPNGLKYEVFAEGKGAKPKATDGVVVHYVGTLPDGKVFDSSIPRGEPAAFPLNGVIAGWTEGLQLMSPGAKYKFYIPAALAYGEEGRPPVIDPNQDLVFEVELLQVFPAEGGAEGEGAEPTSEPAAPPPE